MNRRLWPGCALVVACAVVLGAGESSLAAPAPRTVQEGARGVVAGQPWVLREATLITRPGDVAAVCDQRATGVFTVELPLFEDVQFAFDAESVSYRPGDQILIDGHLADQPDAPAYLTVSGACSGGPLLVSGSIQQRALLYEITPSGDGVSTVREIDVRALPVKASDGPSDPRPYTGTRARRARSAPATGPAVIDVAVGYTDKAAAKLGGLQGLKNQTALAEQRMNDSLQAAGVDGQVRFGWFFKADYTGSEDSEEVLNAVLDDKTPLGAQARKARETHHTDLVSVISDVPKTVGQEYTAGIANTPTRPTLKPTREADGGLYEASAEYAYFSAVDAVDLPNSTMAHELGHNLSLWHDDLTLERGNPAWKKNPHYPYNRGWVVPSQKHHSIMAYGSACSPAYSCATTQLYSSPTAAAESGETLGNAEHDNARVLRQTFPVVAQYRTPPTPTVITHALTLTGSPAQGGTVEAGEPGPYEAGSKVTVTATPKPGYAFTGWKLDGKDAGAVNPRAVLMDAPHALSATFTKTTAAPVTYPVTTTTVPPSGGTVTLTPAPGRGYTQGARVTAHAKPAPGYRFVEFDLDGRQAGTDPELDFTVSGPHQVSARFAKADRRLNLTVAGGPKTGTVQAADPGPYADGASTVIDARPAPGYRLASWTIDGQDSPPQDPLRLTMDRDHTVTAHFTAASYTLTTRTTGPTGSGRITPAPGRLPAGRTLILKALPAKGFRFTGWQVDGINKGRTSPLPLTMDADHTVTAAFDCAVAPGPHAATARTRDALLGCATASETTAKAGGRSQAFAGGAVYWSPKSGQHVLRGGILAKWKQLGAEAGKLGYPTTDATPVTTRTGTKGSCQRFTGGAICTSPGTGTHAVLPPVLAAWDRLGGATGRLGLPTGDMTSLTQVRGGDGPVKGSVQDFEGGSLVYDAGTRKTTVQGS
ncbi:InlB B-repeat-containing protein [Streptomyces sp. NPDC001941]|uniref:InlB B-repeat-containing protein n=1 Tax=Streptomyces sp. NPDC001941 TaxID=3154659 RepID=UPI00331D2E48